MKCLTSLSTPQLKKIHTGKVRESFRVNDSKRMIVVTDRISCFDKVLKTPIPFKGTVLNELSKFWFFKTKDIIANHFIECIDPQVMLVREAEPIRIEMVVRKFLTGSMWRKYQNGARVFSGVKVPDGMAKNQAFSQPIITPTTKEENDREITPEEIIKLKIVEKKIYEEMERIALQLFKAGTEILNKKNIILVDTKYEFGLIDGKLVLIDEIHTPDSSRFWFKSDYEKDRENVEQLDKEFVRLWLLNNKKENGDISDTLPDSVVEETTKKYIELYQTITGDSIKFEEDNNRLYRNLVKSGLIKQGFIAIIMGSPADIEYCNKIKSIIEKYNIKAELRVVSAHKNGEELVKISRFYNETIEPGAIIAVAGQSNGLGGALAANCTIPVISCPPFKDKLDMMLNINSSLLMPSKVPSATVIEPENAAVFALRALNLPYLKEQFKTEIEETKLFLKQQDKKIRND